VEVSATLLDINYVLNDILSRMNDKDLRKGLTKGFYISLVQQMLKKLSVQTFYNTVTIEVPMPSNGVYLLPADFFNMELLYAFNGSCCNPNQGSANIYFKRTYQTKDARQGYTAMNKGDEQNCQDPYFFHGLQTGGLFSNNNFLFGNVQNGNLMLSRACALGYSGLQLTYNSTGVEVGEKPAIPNVLQEVVEDLVCYEACLNFIPRYPKSAYGGLLNIYKDKLYNRLNGTWWSAMDTIKQSHTWEKECMSIYSSNYGNW